MKNVMVDLETWGRASYACVVQIGACYFDPATGEIGDTFSVHVNAKSEMARGFRVDPDTLYWWFSQSKDAQEQALGTSASRLDSYQAWYKLNAFVKGADSIWLHASFDGAMVNEHLRLHKIFPSFPYWAMKDLRTLVEMAKIDTRQYKATNTGIAHSALDDCKLQVKYTVDAMKVLANVRTGGSL
jgi:hypothetical protein